MNYLKSYLEESHNYGYKVGYVYGIFKGYYLKCEFSRNANTEKGIYSFPDDCEQDIKTMVISKRNLINLIKIKMKVYNNEKISLLQRIRYHLWIRKTNIDKV